MKNLTKSALLLASLGAVAFAHADEDVNYGDPTASFTMAGASVQENGYQFNGMYGAGSHILQADLGATTKKGEEGINGRGRYFYVTDGLGYSVDMIANRADNFTDGAVNTTMALGGAIYKIGLTDNIMVFPMLSAGAMQADVAGVKSYNSSLVQAGVYAMYAFNAGHWLYANPKVTTTFDEDFNNAAGHSGSAAEIEVGGGYMIGAASSVGFKLEHSFAASSKLKDNTTAWIQGSLYF